MTTLIKVTADMTTPVLAPADRATCLHAIRCEYGEMPGLALTRRQIIKLWNLAPEVVESLLGELVACGFLRRNATGRYVRADLTCH